MDPCVTRSEDSASICATVSPPVGDNPACALNDWYQSGHIPAIERGLHDDVDEAEGQRSKDVTIPSEPAHADGALHATESGLFGFGKICVRMGRAEDSVGNVGAGSRPKRSAVTT